MNPIEDLKTEHEAVRLSLRILQHIADDIDQSARMAHTDDIADILDFFRVFVDRCHHGKEETLLFPALESLGVGNDGGPIGVMLDEHEQGRRHVAEMALAIEPGQDAADRFVTHARAFIHMLELHIEKENHILFPIGEKHLPAETMAQLQSGFDRIEKQTVGPGRHRAFHGLLDRLEQEYLGRN